MSEETGVTEDEQREALMRFAKAFGDASSGFALAMVAIAAAAKECMTALDEFAAATTQREDRPDDTDPT